MEKNNLIKIIDYWSYWDKNLPDSVPREVNFPKSIKNSLALIVQGVRRSGKTTLLTQIIKHYKLDPKLCCFINFEDPRLAKYLHYSTLDKIVEIFTKMHPKKKLYFFFDEIQDVEAWEKWIFTQLERPSKNHFVLTGSNASLLSGELSTALSGRHISMELYPLSYSEIKKVKPKIKLKDFLIKGGFPEPISNKDSDRLLMQYFNDIIERDLRERLTSRTSKPIKEVVQMVFESTGSEISLRRIAAATGYAVDTVSNYLEAANLAYLLFPCQFFAFSAKKRANKNVKYYPVDTGLRRVVVTKTGLDLGKMLEISVFLELKKRFKEVYYWSEKGEVEFIINTSNGITPIQVSLEKPQERHFSAIDNFYENFHTANEAVYMNMNNYEEALEKIS